VNCRQAEDLLIEYLYGELDSESAESMRAHLDECQDCAAKLAELNQVREVVAGLPEPEPTRIAVNKVLVQAREAAEARRPLWSLGWLKVLAPLCVMAVVGGLVLFQLNSGLISDKTFLSETKQIVSRSAQVLPPKAEEKMSGVRDAGTGKVSRGVLVQPKPDRARPVLKKERAETTSAAAPPDSPLIGSGKGAVIMKASRMEGERAKVGQATTPPLRAAPGSPKPVPPNTARGMAVAPSEARETRLEVRPAEPAMALDTERRAGFKSRSRTGGLWAKNGAPSRDEDRLADKDRGLGLGVTGVSVPALLDRAEEALKAGQYDRAEKIFLNILRHLPQGRSSRPRALLGLARAYEGLGNLTQARRAYQALAAESPAHGGLARRKIEELAGP